MWKTLLPNPWMILAFVVALVGTFFYGKHIGTEVTEAQQMRDEMLAERVYQAAQQGAASATIKVETTHKTIQSKAKETIREIPVYRDCINDPIVERLLGTARENRLPSVADRTRELPEGTPASTP